MKCAVCSSVLYAAETWTMTQADGHWASHRNVDLEENRKDQLG